MTPWKWLSNISNLYYLVAMGLCIIAFIGYILNPNFRLPRIYDIVFGISIIGFFLKNSGFIYSKYIKLLNLSISIIILGALFKLLHWPYSFLIFVTALVSAFVVYLIYFLKKQKKKLLDYLKVILAFCYSANKIFILMHYPYQLELAILLFLFLMISIIIIVKKNYQTKNWFWN